MGETISVTVDPVQTSAEAPALIAGKYKDEGALDQGLSELLKTLGKDVVSKAALYKELESKMGKPLVAPDVPPPVVPEVPAVTPAVAPTATPEVPPGAPDGIPETDFSKYSQEFADKGALSAETYAELLTKHNLPQGVVDQYIEGQRALAEAHNARIVQHSGGEDAWNQMVTWAAANLTVEEKIDFNARVTDRALYSTAIDALKARFTRSNGATPRLLEGSGGLSASSSAFNSQAELNAAIKDPRYQSDAAYRDEVKRKAYRMK